MSDSPVEHATSAFVVYMFGLALLYSLVKNAWWPIPLFILVMAVVSVIQGKLNN